MKTEWEMSDAQFQEAVASAIARRDGEALGEAVGSYATFCEKDVQFWEAFPDGTFQFVTDLLAKDHEVEFDGIWHLFLLFRYEWSRLSASQRETLLPLLGKAYQKPMGDMTRFVICELLGEFYSNSDALDLLKQFGKMESEQSRLFVPHALEHLIEETVNPTIRAAALDYLTTLQSDTSERVREEANAAAKATGNRIAE